MAVGDFVRAGKLTSLTATSGTFPGGAPAVGNTVILQSNHRGTGITITPSGYTAITDYRICAEDKHFYLRPWIRLVDGTDTDVVTFVRSSTPSAWVVQFVEYEGEVTVVDPDETAASSADIGLGSTGTRDCGTVTLPSGAFLVGGLNVGLGSPGGMTLAPVGAATERSEHLTVPQAWLGELRPGVVGDATMQVSIHVTAGIMRCTAGWAAALAAGTSPEPPDPEPTTGVDLDVYDEDDTFLGTITGGFDKKFRAALQETGFGSFKVRRDASNADLIEQGRTVKVTIPRISASPIWMFFIENIKAHIVSDEEEGGEIIEVSGRGPLAYLDRPIQWKQSFVVPAGEDPDGVSEGPASTGNKAGQLLNRHVTEWQHASRPQQPIPLLTRTFNYTVDSLGATWTTTPMTDDIAIGYVGERGLVRVMKLIGTGELDVLLTPDFVLGGYNSYGRDLTSATFASGKVRFAKGVNIADRMERQIGTELPITHMVIRGEGVYATEELPDAGSRIVNEGFLQTEGTDPTALAAQGLAELVRQLRNGESAPFQADVPRGTPNDLTGQYLPGPAGTNGAYWLGDMVTLHTGSDTYDFTNEDARVMALTIWFDEADNLRCAPELLATIVTGRFPSTGSRGTFGGASSGGGGAAPPGAPPPGADLSKHVTDPVDAHDASAVSFNPTGLVNVTADNVQDAIEELDAVGAAGATVVIAHGSMGATETFVFSAPPVATVSGPVHTGTLNADLTATLSGATSGEFAEWLLILTQDGTGGRSITWPAAVVDPPALDETAGTTSAVYLYSTDGGTTIYTGDDVGASNDILGHSTTELDTTLVLAPDGVGGVTFIAQTSADKHRLQTITASGAAQTLDIDVATTFDITLTANCTLTISNPPVAGVDARITIILRQGAGAPWTVTWPGSVFWQDSTDGGDDGTAPTLWTDVDAVDVVELSTLDGGVSWGGTPLGASAAFSLTVQDEGTPLATDATTLNFVGSGVVASGTGATKTITISGGSSTAIGELLISDTPSTPLVFADLIQTEAQDDLVYADT